MPQPDHIMALEMPDDAALIAGLDADMQKYFAVCQEKLGFIPNVLKAYATRPAKLKAWVGFYNELMLGDSALSKLEREMIAVVVSSANHCFYCLVAHGQAVRALSDDSELGELLTKNFRAADLDSRHSAILEFADKLTRTPWAVSDQDRASLRGQGLSDEEIFDVVDVAGFFNSSNRVATGLDMMPNTEYHGLDR